MKCLPIHWVLLSALLFIAGTTPATGQARLSLKVGGNQSFLEVDSMSPDQELESKGGFNAGIDVRFENFSAFFWHPGIHYHTSTVAISMLDSPVLLEEEARVKSLKFPLQAGYYLTSLASLIRVHVKAGLVPEVVLSVKEPDSIGFGKEQINDFQLSACAGLGFDFTIITLDVRYDLGLSSYYTDLSGHQNDQLVISAGFIF